MTTTTDNNTALAVRDLTDSQIKQRIELNRQSGWGLEKGTPPQLNMVFLYCQKLKLLPGDEVTLYEGRPWITVDGRVTLMRRHPDYRGHSQRPLTREEKELWGYDAEDIVVETTVRTASVGPIQAHGRVSKEEWQGIRVDGVRHNPVARHHRVEMAMKRSLSRGERFSFGSDSFVDDEDAEELAQVVVEERTRPEVVAKRAAEYEGIFGSENTRTAYDLKPPRTVDVGTGEVLDQEKGERPTEQEVREEQPVGSEPRSEPSGPAGDSNFQRLQELLKMAKRRKLSMEGQPQPGDGIEAAIAYWDARIRQHDEQAETARQKASEGLL